MNKTIFTFFLTVFILLIAPIKESKACIDPDSVVNIIVNYDTVNAPLISEVEIRLTNLRLMNENKNKICSCALSKYSDLFTSIDYVAFVDSGTNNPYLGFAQWNMTASASTAWNNSKPGFSWDGYIADVINSGLSSSDPVDLVIRASTPAGKFYTLVGDSTLQAASLQQAVESESLGTDEWSTANNDLVASHQGVRGFNSTLPGNFRTYVARDISYFTTLDNEILNNIPIGLVKNFSIENNLEIYPVPAESEINFRVALSEEEHVTINLYSILGKKLSGLVDENYNSGVHTLTVPTLEYPGGMYIVESIIGDEKKAVRILIK
jgi:hypothetical protein